MNSGNIDKLNINQLTTITSLGVKNKIMKQMANIFRSVISSLAVIMLFSATCSAQALNDIQGSFNNYKQSALQEKVFVHTDKGSYLTGEIVWFKIYVVNGINNQPLGLS